MLNPWLALSFKTFQLCVDAQRVMALRMLRLASGGVGAQEERSRMTIEKAAAVTEAQVSTTAAVLAGQKDHIVVGKALKVFKKRVRANKRRLSRR
jgi:hypothetical protein